MVDDSQTACKVADLVADVRGCDRDTPPQLREEGGAGAAPLVNNTKSIHRKRDVIDQETGEIQSFTLNQRCREFVRDSDPDQSRFERWDLQGVASQALIDDHTPRGGQWRVCTCLRKRIADDVRVLRSVEHKTAHYANLQTCGSVWTCPICAAKISERRKGEIEAAANLHQEAGGALLMVTLTFRHDRADDLGLLIGSQADKIGLRHALQKFRNSRTYKSVSEKLELIGLIRNLEVTHSDRNGWHPHVHELWLVRDGVSERELSRLKSTLFDAWYDACGAAKLGQPTRQRGLDIVRAKSPAEYLQKWGRESRWSVGSELAKSHIKSSRSAKGRTPFDILRAIRDGFDLERNTRLFREYAGCFFGARQCFWTAGLKTAFGIDDLSDEEIAAQQDDSAIEITSITADQWRAVLAQKFDARVTVLKLAETGGCDAVSVFLNSLSAPAAVVVTPVPVEPPTTIEAINDSILAWARQRQPLPTKSYSVFVPEPVLPLGQIPLFDTSLLDYECS